MLVSPPDVPMKPLLSYGLAATVMLVLIYLIKGIVGIEIALIIAAAITYFGLTKAFPIKPVGK